MTRPPPCAICQSATEAAGTKVSGYSRRAFELAHCPTCGFSFVVDPRTDFAELYSPEYYAGNGADPDVDYERALHDRKATQRYEWDGVIEIVRTLAPLAPASRWLDFGCGLGGLVRYGRRQGLDITGHDEGYGLRRMELDGVPVLDAAGLAREAGRFDVVTAIEVIEHTPDPVSILVTMASLLKPGGLLYLTTGNAEPFRGRLDKWRYVNPDVHVCFFEPRTLDRALREADLEPEYHGYTAGTTSLIRCKVLRTVGVRRQNIGERMVPWPLASRLADRRYGVTRHPVGRRRR
jgi:SAM-dependent methyltransferase